MAAYLFVHFTMEGKKDEETIWFSVSADGFHWKDIGGKTPVLKSDVGTKGIRDPFIVFDENLNTYFIIATDLNTDNGYSWKDAETAGSRSILIWESQDLIHWSDARLAEVGVEHAGCVWAPEAVYCKEKDSWFVFWASSVKEETDSVAKQRIYGAFTKDFRTFTPTIKYLDAKTDVIDTNIVFDGGWYYRFSKDETHKNIMIERSRELITDQPYERIHSDLLDHLEGVEGPETYYLEAENKWCLIVDQYRIQGGYLPLITEDIASGRFERIPDNAYDMGIRKKRHGGVLSIPDSVMDALIAHYGIYQA